MQHKFTLLIQLLLISSTLACSSHTNPLPTPEAQRRNEIIASLEKNIAKNNDDFESLTALGQLYLSQAHDSADVDQYAHAERLLRRATEVNPTYGPAHFLLGKSLAAQHRFREAVAVADRLYAQDSSRTDALALMFDSQMELGQYTEAQESLNLLRKNPSPAVFAREAQLHEVRGRDADAVNAMIQALSLAASHNAAPKELAWYHYRLGAIYLRLGRNGDAASQFEGALGIVPHFPLALSGLSDTRARQKRFAEAAALAEEAVHTNPTPKTWIAFGDLQTQLEDHTGAQRAYKEAHQIATRSIVARRVYRSELAQFYADQDQHLDDALLLANGEVTDRPNVHSFSLLAWVHYKRKEFEAADEAIVRALSTGIRDRKMYSRAALITAARGKDDRAAAYRKLAAGFGTT